MKSFFLIIVTVHSAFSFAHCQEVDNENGVHDSPPRIHIVRDADVEKFVVGLTRASNLNECLELLVKGGRGLKVSGTFPSKRTVIYIHSSGERRTLELEFEGGKCLVISDAVIKTPKIGDGNGPVFTPPGTKLIPVDEVK